jgi:hypothetical protein
MHAEQWTKATFVFLGDYVDRGPDSKGVLEFLSTLQSRLLPLQSAYFIAGNHDLALALFLGLVPPGTQPDLSFTQANLRDIDRLFPLYSGPGRETMHVQGFRYGMVDLYECKATFRSYGVEPGDRTGLLNAMPLHHQEFLRQLPWVVDLKHDVGRVLAVHSGLVSSSTTPLDEQLQVLHARDVAQQSRWEALSGRVSTLHTIPSELHSDERVFIVSGHHHDLIFETQQNVTRIVCDTFGGKRLAILGAVVLPSCRMVYASEPPVDLDIDLDDEEVD